MPRGLISGRTYSSADILDITIYPRMKEEPLLDDDDCIVVPVRNEDTPHFRKVGEPSFGKRLGREENDPTHNSCVSYIFEELSKPEINSIKFSTNFFADDGTFEEQVVFGSLGDSDYKWYKEADARIAFHENSYIQPDIAGCDNKKFFPRSAYPNVILEVIRTHEPELETFQKLFELSKTNCHIYFYFIGKGRNSSKFNSLDVNGQELKVRISHYLIGGKLYKNGKAYAPQKEGETFKHWYNYLRSSFFTTAKEGVAK
ncbi:hypothetical protein KO505_08835 [Psychrosphaera sp. F3M07]|uniref:hypothetical protein n=1 Tax=Psychrosphaera sp. F3M07 TaxID=2841560 RepID=UPI001C0833B9|nr:hypothetical protein [Psychrosphaera sp. F3M07]MBU2918065.1 hypothetical protein [Psychrosphaera sp. F3M07]